VERFIVDAETCPRDGLGFDVEFPESDDAASIDNRMIRKIEQTTSRFAGWLAKDGALCVLRCQQHAEVPAQQCNGIDAADESVLRFRGKLKIQELLTIAGEQQTIASFVEWYQLQRFDGGLCILNAESGKLLELRNCCG